jgi:cytochrome c peroxidase
VFRDRCASCHAPVLVSDDPASAVPFERWEGLVLTPEGPLVWGRVGYEKTGVVPYVHEQGARVPSLRRLYKKSPYFTNGSAKTLRDVLERARFGQGTFFHDNAPAGLTALSPDEIEASLAFLDLL